MLRWVHAALALALMCALNAHLPLMQIGAWAGMLVTYSQGRTLAEAAAMTFDGEHPCPLCKAIKKQQEAERKTLAPAFVSAKLLIIHEHPACWVAPQAPVARIAAPNDSADASVTAPEVPPPRIG